MNSGVYQLRCTVTGERYIGSSANLKSRRADHLRGLNRGTHPIKRLRELVGLHGIDSIVFEVLEYCPAADNFTRELNWIREAGPELNVQTGFISGRPADPKSLRSLGVDRHTQPVKRFHGPAALFARLAAYCRRAKVSESQTIRDALDRFLSDHKV